MMIHPIFLPTNEEVMKHYKEKQYWTLIKNEKQTLSNNSDLKIKLIDSVVADLIKHYNFCNIPPYEFSDVKKKLDFLIKVAEKFEHTHKRRHENDQEWINNQTTLIVKGVRNNKNSISEVKLSEIFDIAACECFKKCFNYDEAINITCNCLTESGKKISTIVPPEGGGTSDLIFYLGNKFKTPREGKVQNKKDIKTSEKIQKSFQQAKKRKKLNNPDNERINRESMNDSVIGIDTIDNLDFGNDSMDDSFKCDEIDTEPKPKKPKKKYNTEKLHQTIINSEAHNNSSNNLLVMFDFI